MITEPVARMQGNHGAGEKFGPSIYFVDSLLGQCYVEPHLCKPLVISGQEDAPGLHGRIAFGGFGVLIRKNWGEHLPWIVFILAVSALSALWYVSIVNATGWAARPSGSN